MACQSLIIMKNGSVALYTTCALISTSCALNKDAPNKCLYPLSSRSSDYRSTPTSNSTDGSFAYVRFKSVVPRHTVFTLLSQRARSVGLLPCTTKCRDGQTFGVNLAWFAGILWLMDGWVHRTLKLWSVLTCDFFFFFFFALRTEVYNSSGRRFKRRPLVSEILKTRTRWMDFTISKSLFWLPPV